MWKIVARSADQEEIARAIGKEAYAAIPHPPDGSQEVLLPTEPGVARCRICGETRALTREHIPPRSAGNVGEAEAHTLDEWFARSGLDQLPGGEVLRNGIEGYTLCAPCNNNTGGWYVPEYFAWAATIAKMMLEQAPPIEELDRNGERRAIEIVLGSDKEPMRPGRVVRQALAMLCTVSSGYDLAATYPAVRRIILERAQEPLPDGMRLYLTVFLGPGARLAGPSLVANTRTGDWHWAMEVAFPPIALLLVLASHGEIPALWDISAFTQLSTNATEVVRTRVEVGFGHTIYPGDYRSQGRLEAGA